MSLLMDALRKAEQQKQMHAGQEKAAPIGLGELSLEPLDVAPDNKVIPPRSSSNEPEGLPSLPSRLEDLDDQFMAHAPAANKKPAAAAPPPSPPPSPAPEAVRTAPNQSDRATDRATEIAREKAHNLFAAKQAEQSGEQNKRNFAIAIGLITLIAVMGIGLYFWWQLQPKGGLVATGTTPAAPVPPAVPVQQPMPLAAAQPAAQAAVSPAPTFSALAITPAPPVTSRSQSEETLPPPPRRSEATMQQTIAVLQSPPPIRVTTARMKTDPLLDQAWEAFNKGEVDRARVIWEQSLHADPRNADALHGLATVARQQGHAEEAADYCLRALEANPKDTLAIAMLASLSGSSSPQQTESRLGNLLAEQPDSPYLNFALGNLYAQQQRWGEAQQAYFKAHTADSANPDYLFNLAVSLDQLHKPQIAAQYYRQALAAAERQPAGFNPAQVATRLQQLQPDTH